MKKKNNGGPEFPTVNGPPSEYLNGMSLRDYFAGQADLSGYVFPDDESAAQILGIDPQFDDSMREAVRFSLRVQAALRYAIADAMLAAREAQS